VFASVADLCMAQTMLMRLTGFRRTKLNSLQDTEKHKGLHGRKPSKMNATGVFVERKKGNNSCTIQHIINRRDHAKSHIRI